MGNILNITCSLDVRGVWEQMESCICMAEFLCCSPETIITLLIRYVLCLVAQLCLTLCNTIDCSPPGSSVHGYSPSKNTGVNCHALLQGIFLTQGSNLSLLCLLNCRQILYALSHLGSPKETLAKNWTRGNCLEGSYPHHHTTNAKSESCVIRLCPTLCDPMDCSLLGFSV